MSARPRKHVPADDERRWERPTKVAARWGISPRTIRDWVYEGKIEGRRMGTRLLLVDPAEVASQARQVHTVGR